MSIIHCGYSSLPAAVFRAKQAASGRKEFPHRVSVPFFFPGCAADTQNLTIFEI